MSSPSLLSSKNGVANALSKTMDFTKCLLSSFTGIAAWLLFLAVTGYVCVADTFSAQGCLRILTFCKAKKSPMSQIMSTKRV